MRLARSTTAASVVDLPEPVGPVTSTKPRGSAAKLLTDVRHAEVLEPLDVVRDEAERGADGVALAVEVDAEPRAARQAVGEVELEVLLELLALALA